MSGNCQDCPEIFRTDLKLFSLLEIFQCLETFQTVWKLSRLCGKFADSLKTFQTLWKLSRLSANFPDSLETFKTIGKLSRLSGNYSGLSGNFQGSAGTFQTVWYILKLFHSYVDVWALFHGQLCKFAQKLSAKNFQSAMPSRRRGFWDSGFHPPTRPPIQTPTHTSPYPLTSCFQLTRALPQSWNTVSISLIAVAWEKWTGFWQFLLRVFVFVPSEAFALLEFQTPDFPNVKYWISNIYNSGTFYDTLATCLCISPCSPWESPDTFDSNRVPHPLDSRIPLLAIQYLYRRVVFFSKIIQKR